MPDCVTTCSDVMPSPLLFLNLTLDVGGRSFLVCFSFFVGRLEAEKAHRVTEYGHQRNVGCALLAPEFQALRVHAREEGLTVKSCPSKNF
jgi:hypothetical protein